MRVVCRVLVIWMTTVLLFVQAIAPTTLLGCACQKRTHEDNQVSHQKSGCCSAKCDLGSGAAPRSCCSHKTRLVDTPDCNCNSARCCCGQKSNMPALPVKTNQAQETLLVHQSLTHDVASYFSQPQNHADQASDISSRSLLSQKYAQVLLCVSLI